MVWIWVQQSADVILCNQSSCGRRLFCSFNLSAGEKCWWKLYNLIYLQTVNICRPDSEVMWQVDMDGMSHIFSSLVQYLQLDDAYNILVLNPRRDSQRKNYGYRWGVVWKPTLVALLFHVGRFDGLLNGDSSFCRIKAANRHWVPCLITVMNCDYQLEICSLVQK